ncbi:SDR family oxidoreductase [Paenibacillus sp. UMB4589-SE434]|uniref:SDR family oxidoreductase n=1 Tax=Paenibacillus sp. UMB4589-SE434 TaxID=3046314 RepID=UPI00254C8AF5|nr:SDR family oxidoreductase [Paenibacillus sp. UMB4589-SE434]MDK8181925.1 SDR family oxidoreductase [Paenibacillus sp. UMB4589-SE434]
MELQLQGKVAIVLASSKGLGYAAAEELAREGALVTLVGRNEAVLHEAEARMLAQTGSKPILIQGDITKAEHIERIVASTMEQRGRIDILINNCGGPSPGTFDQLSDEAWQQGFELTLLSYVRSIRAVLPYMRKQQFGRIVNMTSSTHKQPIESLMLSSTFRVGVLGLAKTLAPDLARDQILINTVGPGRYATDRVIQLDRLAANHEGVDQSFIEDREKALIPMGRYGQPEEMGRLIAFLASPTNSYMTGQAFLVDGGAVRAL